MNPRRWWEDNIWMDLKEIGINTRNWVESAQNRDYSRALVNTALNLRVPKAKTHVNEDYFIILWVSFNPMKLCFVTIICPVYFLLWGHWSRSFLSIHRLLEFSIPIQYNFLNSVTSYPLPTHTQTHTHTHTHTHIHTHTHTHIYIYIYKIWKENS